ncbi:hypothetical protein ABG79_02184 [Caloramator mitchellensis]|uniref:Phage protein, HK97 gp10 family n=1 Tax=Caloramator mitchellensis TaxID=908809 RepID=A0A0R3JY51_CALMK|nr:HK97 gp10 family phage protein [Caloramator mitchellensis]KRQ86052.1 hypothetical protein ABG79_02184 [Caloramator mitchellensis]
MSGFELKWRGNLAKEIAREAAKKALLKCGADLQGKSAEQAPIDTGDLRRNCSVVLDYTKYNIGIMSVLVGYDLPYARRQHEGLHFKHPKGGRAKFLEVPFEQNKGKYRKYIQKAIKDALEKG